MNFPKLPRWAIYLLVSLILAVWIIVVKIIQILLVIPLASLLAPAQLVLLNYLAIVGESPITEVAFIAVVMLLMGTTELLRKYIPFITFKAFACLITSIWIFGIVLFSLPTILSSAGVSGFALSMAGVFIFGVWLLLCGAFLIPSEYY